jgi:hypothetical protein
MKENSEQTQKIAPFPTPSPAPSKIYQDRLGTSTVVLRTISRYSSKSSWLLLISLLFSLLFSSLLFSSLLFSSLLFSSLFPSLLFSFPFSSLDSWLLLLTNVVKTQSQNDVLCSAGVRKLAPCDGPPTLVPGENPSPSDAATTAGVSAAGSGSGSGGSASSTSYPLGVAAPAPASPLPAPRVEVRKSRGFFLTIVPSLSWQIIVTDTCV